MKSKIKITLGIVAIILISIIVIFVIYKEKNPKEKNIFDEMYYGEKKVYSRFGNSPFGKIPGIESWSRKDMVYKTMREDTKVYENYKKNYNTKKLGEWDIGFKFIYDKKK